MSNTVGKYPNETQTSRHLRESHQAAILAAAWVGPLNDAERGELAARLARAGARLANTPAADGLCSPSGLRAGSECRDLYLDVTKRAASVPVEAAIEYGLVMSGGIEIKDRMTAQDIAYLKRDGFRVMRRRVVVVEDWTED
jgi:hypothetical protein